MKLRNKIVLVLSLLALVALPLAAGGGSQSGGGGTAAPAAGGSTATATGKISYPVKTDIVLDYWVELGQNQSTNFANLGDTPYAKYKEQKTGIKVNYLHPATGQGREQFNLIVASGDLPDIMEYSWYTFPGGPEKAISDGVIHRMNDVFDKWAPNIKEYFTKNPDYDKQVKTDSGSYYGFYFIRGNNGLLVTNGPQMRKDWLDELGLAIPETLDDWHTVLRAFRDKKGARAPFSWTQWDRLPFMFAYGEWPRGWRLDEAGKVVYSPIQEGYRNAVTLMAQWYKEGLLDPDFATNTTAQLNQKVVSGATGASAHQVGQGMGTWTMTARPTNPQFELVGVPYPMPNKGEKAKLIYTTFHYTGGATGAITTDAQSVEIAARFLDWNYTEDGHNLNNFGVPGESYNWVNGYPKYSDMVFKNPNGWPPAQAIGAYALSTHSGTFVQDIRYFEQYLELPEQQKALTTWGFPEMHKYMVPPITPTPEESREFASIMQEINTFQQEMEVKFILGTEPLTNWDSYVSNIRRLGIDRALEIQTAALARYNKR